MKTAARRRPGYTLIELLAVITILVIVGGVIAPTFRALSGDSRGKAGADVVRARMAEARSAAIDQGRAYRVAVSADGLKVQVAPDDTDPAGQAADQIGDTDPPVVSEQELPPTVTAVPVIDDGSDPSTDQNGWVRVVTFLPDGTCREDHATVEVREPGSHSMIVRVRGLTGAVSVTTAPAGGGTQP